MRFAPLPTCEGVVGAWGAVLLGAYALGFGCVVPEVVALGWSVVWSVAWSPVVIPVVPWLGGVDQFARLAVLGVESKRLVVVVVRYAPPGEKVAVFATVEGKKLFVVAMGVVDYGVDSV